MRPASDPSALRAFLEHPSRPAGTLTYHELQGFLFTVVSAPDLIQPSEWLPIIFAEEDAVYSNLDEANEILGQIMALYNTINAAVLDPRHRTAWPRHPFSLGRRIDPPRPRTKPPQ